MAVLEERSRQLMASGICTEVFHRAGWQLVFWGFEWTCQLLSELHVTQNDLWMCCSRWPVVGECLFNFKNVISV